MKEFYELYLKLCSLTIFRKILSDNPVKLLIKVISEKEKSIDEKISEYSDFVSNLYLKTENLTDYIWELIESDENIYIKKYAQNENISTLMEQSLDFELKALEELSQIESKEIIENIGYNGYLPLWKCEKRDFTADYKKYKECIAKKGYGIYTKHLMFFIKNDDLVPIYSFDKIRISDLKGYEKERNIIIENTLNLIRGKQAANVLLYGDAGTGKSSTVKAIVNEFGHLGLRLIEIKKDQLNLIPTIVEKLLNNPLKFILFIDDLTFNGNEEEFGGLKAILEGSASVRPKNTVIYATSNRRHLIRETFSDRGDNDIHINETIQEQVSLSERFGLSVYFSIPNKDEYLMIVKEIINQYNIDFETEKLFYEAEKYALRRGGRSPRIAKQFAESIRLEKKL